jgi:hypothetical protein
VRLCLRGLALPARHCHWQQQQLEPPAHGHRRSSARRRPVPPSPEISLHHREPTRGKSSRWYAYEIAVRAPAPGPSFVRGPERRSFPAMQKQNKINTGSHMTTEEGAFEFRRTLSSRWTGYGFVLRPYARRRPECDRRVKRAALRFHPTSKVTKSCTVPSSTSLNAALGGVVSGRTSFASAAVLDVPCDTSPGGLFRTMTPRSSYNTPGRAQVRVVVDSSDPAARP